MLSPRDTPKVRDEIIQATRGQGWLRRAELYWASEDMSLLTHDQHTEMPAWTPSLCRPTASGLLILAEEPSALDALRSLDRSVTELYVVFTWRTLEDGALEVTSYSYCPGVEVTLLYAVEIPADQTLPLDEDMLEPTPQVEQLREALHGAPRLGLTTSMGHDSAALLGCAWILMQTPTVADSQTVRQRARGGGTARSKQKFDTVQYITLRRLAQDTTETPGHEGREYQHRWLVRGHWRQQRVGPGRKFRRPTYVAPHIKGPEGAPLKTERVNIWRR
ncbi:hypothetical protein [Corynebacterium phocae]|uniref:hypothetical protein n=1 Tax=Corynebacterium phocae TaxID=161895 RepID=UPI000951130F|nr:hypothetical protein [Corynebacterium phocae]